MEDGSQPPGGALVKAPDADLEPLPPRSMQVPGATPGISAPVEQTGLNHLAMNVFVPGLGSLVRGQKGPGAAQMGLVVLGLGAALTLHILVGLLLILAGWGWSIASGIGFVKTQKMEWR